MPSPLTEAMIVNGVVLATVLATDLGSARKITRMRLLRPVIAAAVIVPLFVSRPVTHGNGLIVEIAGVIAGLLGGLAAMALMGVYRSPDTGKPVSSAGVPYAVLWTAIIGARAAFSYGAAHWFTAPLVSWAITPDRRASSPRVRPGHIPAGPAASGLPGVAGRVSLSAGRARSIFRRPGRVNLQAGRRPSRASGHKVPARRRPAGHWPP